VDGGGIYVDESLDMTGGSISGNTATTGDDPAFGGGLDVDDTTSLSGVTINDNTLSSSIPDDDEAYGGGIYDDYNLVSVTNSTISGNAASAYFVSGGGLAITDGAPTISGSTIDNNQAKRRRRPSLGWRCLVVPRRFRRHHRIDHLRQHGR
jgi:hypothetical protein